MLMTIMIDVKIMNNHAEGDDIVSDDDNEIVLATVTIVDNDD